MNPPIWPLFVSWGLLVLLLIIERWAAYSRREASKRLQNLLDEWRETVRQEAVQREGYLSALRVEAESRKAGIAEIRSLQAELKTIYQEMFSVPPTT